MKGEKGVCLIGITPNQVRRTKFDSEENVKDAMEFHIVHGLIDPSFVIYKCKHCKYFHFGKKEWKEQFEVK